MVVDVQGALTWSCAERFPLLSETYKLPFDLLRVHLLTWTMKKSVASSTSMPMCPDFIAVASNTPSQNYLIETTGQLLFLSTMSSL